MNLIERIEGADGPSRELDDEVAEMLFTGKHRVCIKGLSDEAGGMWMFHYPNGSVGSSLRFTGSLDAAVTLVPEGCKWQISTEEPGPWAWVGQPGSDIPAIMAATPALALCAAALRAIGDTHDD